jgi:hypothetical protein
MAEKKTKKSGGGGKKKKKTEENVYEDLLEYKFVLLFKHIYNLDQSQQ